MSREGWYAGSGYACPMCQSQSNTAVNLNLGACAGHPLKTCQAWVIKANNWAVLS